MQISSIQTLIQAGAERVRPPGFRLWLEEWRGGEQEAWLTAPHNEWLCWSAAILRPQATCNAVHRLMLDLCRDVLGESSIDTLYRARFLAGANPNRRARLIPVMVSLFTEHEDIYWALSDLVDNYVDAKNKTQAAAWQKVADEIKKEVAGGVGVVDRLCQAEESWIHRATLVTCAVRGYDTWALLRQGDAQYQLWALTELFPEQVEKWAQGKMGENAKDESLSRLLASHYREGRWVLFFEALLISWAKQNPHNAKLLRVQREAMVQSILDQLARQGYGLPLIR